MPINLLRHYGGEADSEIRNNADSGTVNLLKKYAPTSSEDSSSAMELARAQISEKYPLLPSHIRDALLKITPTDASPNLQEAGPGTLAFSHGLWGAPVHMAQNVTNFPGAVANTFGANVPRIQIPEELDPLKKEDKENYPLASMLGELAGDVTSGGLAIKGASSMAGPGTSLLKRVFGGGLTGAAITDSDSFGGRPLGAFFGSAIPAAHGLSDKTITSRATDLAKNLEEKHSDIYKDIFSNAAWSDIVGTELPGSINKDSIAAISKYGNKKYANTVARYLENPTLDNAHKAQSDLGKIVRKVEGQRAARIPMASGEHEAAYLANDLRDEIKNSIHSSLTKGGREDLSKLYNDVTNSFREEVVPLRTPAINKYMAGKSSLGKAASSFMKDDAFSLSEMSKRVPGYSAKKTLEKILGAGKPLAKTIGYTVPTLGGGAYLYNLLKRLGD